MNTSKYKKIKTLLIYLVYREGIDEFYEGYIKRLNETGFSVEGFCITLNPPGPRMSFHDLDSKWKSGDTDLIQLYLQLKQKAKRNEVLVLLNGANLHPEFLKELSTFNVYGCFDDPESSSDLSEPVAKYFDACLVGNIASLIQYESWGCKNIFFRPLGYYERDVYSARLTKEQVVNRKNDINVSLFCERVNDWRKDRLDYLLEKIPDIYARGLGWPGGWVSEKEKLGVYSRTKIGINLHNSTGPINVRTFALPANGIMQICDNRFFLGHIFELGKEVVGYNFIDEVPDLVKFYLKNETQRKKIAVAGWERATRDYNEVAIWDTQMRQIFNLIK